MLQDSLTPPSSPLVQNVEELEQESCDVMETNHSNTFALHDEKNGERLAASFCCLGSVCQNSRHCHPFGPLRKGALLRILKGENVSMLCDFKQLFGFDAEILAESPETLFLMARQELSTFESKLNSIRNDVDLTDIKRNLRRFFDYIISCIIYDRFTPAYQSELVSHFTAMLLQLNEQLGQLLRLVAAASVSDVTQHGLSVHQQVFHAYLDVYWAMIETFHALSLKASGTVGNGRILYRKHLRDVDSTLVNQAAYMVTSYVTFIAFLRYERSRAEQLESKDWSAFSCTCLRELLVMLNHLMTFRCNDPLTSRHAQSFSHVLRDVIQDVLANKAVSSEHRSQINSDQTLLPSYGDGSSDDKLSFVWWFMSHVVTIYQYDEHGTYSADGVAPLDTTLAAVVSDLVKRTCSMTTAQHADQRVKDATVSRHLRYLLELNRTLPANMSAVATLWEHFYKRLNEPCRLPGNPVSDMSSSTMCTSAAQLLDAAKAIVQQRLDAPASSTCPYALFLCVLCQELRKAKTQGAANPFWRGFKGRFFCKFHTRRMQELSEAGLQNFTALFLSLAQVIEPQELVNKLCEYLSMLPVSTLDLRRRLSVWRGSFSAMLLLVEHDVDIKFLAERLNMSLNAVASALCDSSLLPADYSKHWPLIELYTDAVQDVIQCSTRLDLHQHLLIPHCYKQVLEHCKQNHVAYLLNFTLEVLSKLRQVSSGFSREARASSTSTYASSQHLQLCDVMWRVFYTFVKQHACSETPTSRVADVAAAFTLLACHERTGVSVAGAHAHDDVRSCFLYFASHPQVNAIVTCRYLVHLLANADVMTRLRADVVGPGGADDVTTALIIAWLHCAWHVTAADTYMLQLNRAMTSLDDVRNITAMDGGASNTDDACFIDSTSPPTVLTFIAKLGRKFDSCTDLKSRQTFRNAVLPYFAGVKADITNVIKTCASTEKLASVYTIGGQLVKHCANLLYEKTRPECVLHELISRLLCLRTLMTSQTLPPHVHSALKHTLHLFVIGLSKLDYKRDSYVDRQLRDIIANYLPRFNTSANTGSASAVHPLLTAIDVTFTQSVPADAAAFRAYVLSLVVRELLKLHGSSPPVQSLKAWQWLAACQQRTSDDTQVAKDAVSLLRTCLDYVLLVDHAAIKQQACTVLQMTLQAVEAHQDSVDIEVLAKILGAFVKHQFPVYERRVLTKALLTVSVLCPCLATRCISDVTACVKQFEAKRGVGIDKQLRVAYRDVLRNCGEAGEREIGKLLRTT